MSISISIYGVGCIKAAPANNLVLTLPIQNLYQLIFGAMMKGQQPFSPDISRRIGLRLIADTVTHLQSS
uniref:Uncharacterized protein n=1 Tax=mine drainage metagenome TaxID=410659 RepID=E6QT81_9ZZZZ